MTLRKYCTPEQLAAHSFLDDVRAGIDVHGTTVAHSLRLLGEQPELLKKQPASPIKKMQALHKKLRGESKFQGASAVRLCIKYLNEANKNDSLFY